MKINTVVEATPQMIKDNLLDHLQKHPEVEIQDHGFHVGDFARFTPSLAQGLNLDPESPVLIKRADVGALTILCLFYNSAGDIQEHAFAPNQLLGEEPAPGDTALDIDDVAPVSLGV